MITLQNAKEQLALWLKADEKVSRGQSYTHDGCELTRADAATITDKIIFWENKVRQLSGSRRRGITQVVVR